jgi:hypothetical protein
MSRKNQNREIPGGSASAGSRPSRRKRSQRRIAAVEDRAYFTRREVSLRYGMSDKRLAEAMKKDPKLPVIKNGRYQIFPKAAFDSWFQAAASKRLNVHGPESVRVA